MGLSKSISVHGSGVIANYWRLSGLNIDLDAQDARITMSGYVDQAARLAGLRPITQMVVRWTGAQNPITQENMVAGAAFAIAYQKLIAPETRPFMPANPFTGATPVL